MKRAILYTSAAIAALTISGGTSFAQDKELRQDEIVVTNRTLYSDQLNSLKSPTAIIDVPQSLSIISSDQIIEQGFTAIGDIINYVPGINASQGEGHRDAVVFRGVRSTASFFVDGVRDDVQYFRSLYNLEQVEVLRGPNALLFGRGGTGGVLNRVTKKGQIGESFVGAKASIDTFGEYDVQLDQNIATGENSAFRINGFYESLANDRDFYDGQRVGINPTARFALSANTTLDVSYEYADNQRFIDRGIPTGADGEPVEALKEVVFGDAEINTSAFNAQIVRLGLQHKFTDSLKGNFSASYGDYDKLYQNFYAAGYDASNDAYNGAETVTLDGYVDTTQRTNAILSANLVGEFATGSIQHTLIFGGEYIDTSNDNDRYNTYWSTNGDDQETFLVSSLLDLKSGVGVNADGLATSNNFNIDLNDKTTSNVEVTSFYVQDEISINQYVDIVLGARFDSFDQSSTNLNTATPVEISRKDENIAPRLGLVYKPQENMSVYASYSETFLPRSGEQFASTGSLDPDIYENAEIGFKWDFAPTLSFTAAIFQSEQISAARDDTGEDFEVRGLEVSGLELQVQGDLNDKLSILAGYSYLDGETDQGREIPRELPEHMLSAWAKYAITDKFGLGLGAIYQAESYISDFDIGVSSDATHPTLPAYTRFDAAAFYNVSDDLRLQLNIENLSDETYFPSAHSTHQASVGSPLNARFTISTRF